jgi:hypothetical protein
VSGVVFDAGALIALERGDRAMMVLVAEADVAATQSRFPLRASPTSGVILRGRPAWPRSSAFPTSTSSRDIRALDARVRVRRV